MAYSGSAKVEGIFAAPEGAASLVAYRKLRANGFFKPEDTVVLFNTGSGLKYAESLQGAPPIHLAKGAPLPRLPLVEFRLEERGAVRWARAARARTSCGR